MQPIRTIWTILVGDHPGTIPDDFVLIPISGSREEVVWIFPYIILGLRILAKVGIRYVSRYMPRDYDIYRDTM